MTKEQFEDIQNKLAKLREERGLSVEEQKRNFEVNYSKELTDFFEARRDNNEYGMIDALCDMVIVAMNAGGKMFFEGDRYKSIDKTAQNLTYPLFFGDCIHCILYEIKKKRYDPYLCLLETIKELNTRTGKWNEKEGKWCKDLGAYTLEEALEKAYDAFSDLPVLLSLALLKEDKDFWLFGEWEGDLEYFEDKTMEEILDDFDEVKIKIKKWYKADYDECKYKNMEVMQ